MTGFWNEDHEAPAMRQSRLAFLDPGIVAHHQAAIARIVTAAAQRGGLALVGSALLPAKCARGLAAAGAKPRCLIEFDARYWGRTVEGVPVVAPQEAFALLGEDPVVIVAVWSPNHAFTANSGSGWAFTDLKMCFLCRPRSGLQPRRLASIISSGSRGCYRRLLWSPILFPICWRTRNCAGSLRATSSGKSASTVGISLQGTVGALTLEFRS